jgi:parallel beta-helix repeat protein
MLLPAGAGAADDVGCGRVVTHSLSLANDLGPCPGDGLLVTRNGVIVNLNGHTITGANVDNTNEREQIGIHLMNVTGASIVGPGTVQGFDAGVVVDGGSRNRILGLTARDNINHVVLTGCMNACNYGDGIVAYNSSDNTIADNHAIHNGPYDGIGLVDASHRNRVRGNESRDNTVSNILPTGEPGPCGPFGGGAVTGRTHQDMGIRIEGPGATHNEVSANITTRNQAAGISIHGSRRSVEPLNTANLVKNNTVTGNGFAAPDDTYDGILSLPGYESTAIDPAYGNTFIGNTVNNNARSGIYVSGRLNTIMGNTVNRNGRDGIELFGPHTDEGIAFPNAVGNKVVSNAGRGNRLFDGEDHHPGCDDNKWSSNRFLTVNQPCVAAHGGTGRVP